MTSLLAIVPSSRFLKDSKLALRRGLDLGKLQAIVLLLSEEEELPIRQRDHALTGEWKQYRECHIQPDWLLIYKIDSEALYLARTGTHSDLFAK